jgi:Cft2 family RNA processing exonuclease
MDKAKLQHYKDEVQGKIDNLLAEFAEGKLNREQFYALYERYNAQMEFAEKSATGAAHMAADGGTVVIRDKYMGKAQGLIIVLNESGNVIETLGTFGVAMTTVLPVLDDFTREWRNGHIVDRVVREAEDNQWLLFVAGRFTTVVTVFKHEPSAYQTQVIQRMHGEFEDANSTQFTKSGDVDATQLVYPFHSFVTRSLNR